MLDPLSYVPHRGKMQWLEGILTVDDDQVLARAAVSPDHLFVRAGHLPAWCLVEYMAQAVAAWAGNRAKVAGRDVKVGYLLGTRRFEPVRSGVPAGAVLDVRARCELMGDNGLGMFACEIEWRGEVIARANLSVFEPPDEAAFLETTEEIR